MNQLNGVSNNHQESGMQGRRRIIDLDILFFGDEILDSDSLRVPHPTIAQRAYALVPLLEIAPNIIHPRLNKTVSQIHESLPQPEQVFLYGTRS
jgi:7,8-dihydro-6-hydroxymethylpterin-pyrophosphokinase